MGGLECCTQCRRWGGGSLGSQLLPGGQRTPPPPIGGSPASSAGLAALVLAQLHDNWLDFDQAGKRGNKQVGTSVGFPDGTRLWVGEQNPERELRWRQHNRPTVTSKFSDRTAFQPGSSRSLPSTLTT